jgi:hypothetical protein
MSEEEKEESPKLYKNPSLREVLLPLILEALDLAENKEKLRNLDLNDPETRVRFAKLLQGLSITASQIDEVFRILFYKDPNYVKALAKDPTFGCVPITTQSSAKLNREGCEIVEAIWDESQGHEDSETLSDCCKGILSSFASLRVNKDKPKGTWKPLKTEIVEIEDTDKRTELIDRIVNLPEDSDEGWAVAMRDWVLLYEEVPEEQREAYRTGIERIYSDIMSVVELSKSYAKARGKIAKIFKHRRAALSRSFDKENLIKKKPTSIKAEREHWEQQTPHFKRGIIRKYMHNYLNKK